MFLHMVLYTEAVQDHWLLMLQWSYSPLHHSSQVWKQSLQRWMLSDRSLHRCRQHPFHAGWWSYQVRSKSYRSDDHRWSAHAVLYRLGTWNRSTEYRSEVVHWPTVCLRYLVLPAQPAYNLPLWSLPYHQLVHPMHWWFFQGILHLPVRRLSYLFW